MTTALRTRDGKHVYSVAQLRALRLLGRHLFLQARFPGGPFWDLNFQEKVDPRSSEVLERLGIVQFESPTGRLGGVRAVLTPHGGAEIRHLQKQEKRR